MEQPSVDIQAFVAGDRAAFKQIYDCYAGKVYNFALAYVGNGDMAGDITQNTFLQLYASRSRLNVSLPVAPYLMSIAKSQVCRELRRMAVAERYQQSAAEMSAQSSYNMTVEDDLTHEALERRITALLGELPESRRRIFLMRWKDGMSNKEVAKALNISDKTVSTQIHRTVTFLQKKLGIL